MKRESQNELKRGIREIFTMGDVNVEKKEGSSVMEEKIVWLNCPRIDARVVISESEDEGREDETNELDGEVKRLSWPIGW